MNAVSYAKMQIEQSFGLLKMCTDGMDDMQFNHRPGGTANSPAKSLVHAASSIDFFVNTIIRRGQMLWPSVAAANNLPANPMEMWSYQGEIAQAPIKRYADEVKNDALAYIATLSDDDLDREIDTQFFGKQSVGWIIQLGGMHLAGHAGDIAAVKGVQGLKGLPF